MLKAYVDKATIKATLPGRRKFENVLLTFGAVAHNPGLLLFTSSFKVVNKVDLGDIGAGTMTAAL